MYPMLLKYGSISQAPHQKGGGAWMRVYSIRTSNPSCWDQRLGRVFPAFIWSIKLITLFSTMETVCMWRLLSLLDLLLA